MSSLRGVTLRPPINAIARFDRNLNTGEDQAHAPRMMKADNTILHDSQHPSALTLPVVPR